MLIGLAAGVAAYYAARSENAHQQIKLKVTHTGIWTESLHEHLQTFWASVASVGLITLVIVPAALTMALIVVVMIAPLESYDSEITYVATETISDIVNTLYFVQGGSVLYAFVPITIGMGFLTLLWWGILWVVVHKMPFLLHVPATESGAEDADGDSEG